MNGENLFISSKAIELSEDTGDDRYITLTNRLCYYDEPNLNNVILPSDNAEEIAQSLIDMPVVAKYRKNYLGKDDLGGHELSFNEDGSANWGTESIGVHKSVEVKDDIVEVNGEKKTLPCLFATAKIWTRNQNFINAIKRLYDEDGLFTSWEIQTKAYECKDGIKTLTDYQFTSNCCLGSNCTPAYGTTSVTLNVASVENSNEMFIAEALQKDLKKDGESMEDVKSEIETTEITETTKEDVVESTEEINDVVEITEEDVIENNDEVVDENIVETQKAITMIDILDEIYKLSEIDGYIAYVFPMEKYVLMKTFEESNELDFVKVSYDVVDNVVSVTEVAPITLTVSYSSVDKVIVEKDKEIEDKVSALVTANETISTLKSEIETLKPFKEEFEKAEQIRVEKELAEKRDVLKDKLVKSGLFTSSEIESDDISKMISEVNESGINTLIADRFISDLDINSKTESSAVKIDISAVDNDETFESHISSVADIWRIKNM